MLTVFALMLISGCAFKVQLQEYTPSMREDMRKQNIRSYKDGATDAAELYQGYIDEIFKELED